MRQKLSSSPHKNIQTWLVVLFVKIFIHLRVQESTVEPRFTDNRIIRTPGYHGQLYLSLGKARSFSLNLTLFLAQSTDSIKKSTLLMNELCAVIDLSFLKEKDLQLTACRCSQCYSTPNGMIFKTSISNLFGIKRVMQRTHGFDSVRYRWAIFEPFVDLVRGMTALWRLEMFNLTMFMSSFISLEF